MAQPPLERRLMYGFSATAMPAGADWLDRRDPRLRLVAALGFALVTVSLQRLPPILAALGAGALFCAGAGLGWRFLARRLLALQGLLALLLLTLPFTVPGEPLFHVGSLVASRDGLLRAVLVLLKANAVVLAMLGLIGGLEPVTMGHALARLRVPDKLVHLFLFTLRYVGLLKEEYVRLQRAMRARGFVPATNRQTWRVLGWMLGMLLVRSMERAWRIAAAMKCRGFHGRFFLLDGPAWRAGDSLFAMALGAGMGGVLALDKLA